MTGLPSDPQPASNLPTSPVNDASRDRSRSLQEEITLLTAQLEEIEKVTDVEQRITLLKSFFPAEASGIRAIQDRLLEVAQSNASLQASFGDRHPSVQAARKVQQVLEERLHQEFTALETAQYTRLKALESALKKMSPENSAVAEDLVPQEEAEEIRRIQTLMANSPDLINAATSGQTLLQEAASKGMMGVARFLLQHGPNVNARGLEGTTALHVAAGKGHKAMVELLLASTADVNAAADHNWTPLHIAAVRGYVAVAEVLLSRGANINAASTDLSSLAGRVQNLFGTPLRLAVIGDHTEMVRLLLSRGADVNLKSGRANGAGNTDHPAPAIESARSPEMVRLLLEHGADPVGDGGIRLLRAIERGEMEVVKALLEAGANPDIEASLYHSTPLLMASRVTSREIGELLLKHGANINQLVGGIAVVHDATRRNIEWLSWVLEKGADPNLETVPPDNSSVALTPLGYLWSSQAPLGENHFWSASLALLRHGADPNSTDPEGWTLVHRAAHAGPPEIFDLLSQNRADPAVRGPRDVTPLMVAVCNTNKLAIGWLLKAGADVNAADTDGFTPLHLAVFKSDPSAVATLLKAGAASDRKGRIGRISYTPVELLRAPVNPLQYTLGVPMAWTGNPYRWRTDGAEEPLSEAEREIERLLSGLEKK